MLIPQWPAPAHVRAVFTTRSGGRSAAPFDSLNLGDHVGDSAQSVAANRQLLRSATGAQPVFLQQVHGTQVLALRPGMADGLQADACMSQHTGLACTVMVADCLPVLLTDRRGRFVAAAHAGWRGLAGVDATGGVGGPGVLEQLVARCLAQTYERFEPFAGVSIDKLATKIIASELLAWLGPCIGPAHFKVGAEVRAAFVASQPGAADHFVALASPGSASAPAAGKYLANLSGLARNRLRALGITSIHGNDGSPSWCTVANPERYFSHRRDAAALGSTGRMAACIWLE